MIEIADPERALALAYAPADRREALALLWRLDERLGAVLNIAHEPLIGAIRLAWWREALEALDTGVPPSEPLLIEIARVLLPLGVTGAALARIEAGWAALLDGAGAQEVALHGERRGGRLFAIAARILGQAADPAIVGAGEGWALVDILPRIEGELRDEVAELAAQRIALSAGRRWPRRLRALGVLSVLAARDARAAGLRRPGSPGRVARALWMGISGR